MLKLTPEGQSSPEFAHEEIPAIMREVAGKSWQRYAWFAPPDTLTIQLQAKQLLTIGAGEIERLRAWKRAALREITTLRVGCPTAESEAEARYGREWRNDVIDRIEAL